jgi:signal peptidase II
MTGFRSHLAGWLRLLWTSLAVVALNFVVKWMIGRWLEPRETWWLAGQWLGFEHVRNSGVAFGIGAGSGWLTAVFVPAALLALIWLYVGGNLRGGAATPYAVGALIGGGLGNALDRLPDGRVTDYLAVGPWPRFNVADTALTLGIVLLLFGELRHTRLDPT